MRLVKILIFIASLASTGAAADDRFYLYGALGAGNADPGIDKEEADAALRSAGAANLRSEVNNDLVGFKVLFGAMLSPNFALELGYVSLGTITYRATFVGGSAKEDAKADGPVIALVAMVPVTNRVSAFGKVGAINATVKVNASVTGAGGVGRASDSDTHWAPNFGAGVIVRVWNKLSVRAEVEKFSNLGDSATTGRTDVIMVSAGVLLRF
jgi:OmpA-OmpF porin, OOP family